MTTNDNCTEKSTSRIHKGKGKKKSTEHRRRMSEAGLAKWKRIKENEARLKELEEKMKSSGK